MSRESNKRILIVAHNFPPLGSGGVHRPVKFARYLREFGWDVDVLTVKNIRYHAYDRSLLDELEGVAVHRAGSLEPLRLSWLAGWRPPPPPPPVESFAQLEEAARRARPPVSAASRCYKAVSRRLFQPDEQVLWWPFAAARGRRLGRERPFDVALTTSPPESCHLVGCALKRATGCRWVADFRDLWSEHHLRRGVGPAGRGLNRLLEARVLREADGVVANTAAMTEYFRRRDVAAERLLTLPNGFDPGDFGEALAKVSEEDFVVVHNGSFRGGRRAATLLRGFAAARARDAAFASRAKLYLLGINRADDLRLAEKLGLGDAVFHVGYIRHAEALRACRGADLLTLVMSAEEGPALVPGKLYEYLGAATPILAAIPPGEARRVLEATTRGAEVCPADEAAAVADGLLAVFGRRRRGALQYETDGAAVVTYTRRRQARTLAAFVETMLQ
jgi:glycosyltransferase involved in cell wall biosynthesis